MTELLWWPRGNRHVSNRVRPRFRAQLEGMRVIVSPLLYRGLGKRLRGWRTSLPCGMARAHPSPGPWLLRDTEPGYRPSPF